MEVTPSSDVVDQDRQPSSRAYSFFTATFLLSDSPVDDREPPDDGGKSTPSSSSPTASSAYDAVVVQRPRPLLRPLSQGDRVIDRRRPLRSTPGAVRKRSQTDGSATARLRMHRPGARFPRSGQYLEAMPHLSGDPDARHPRRPLPLAQPSLRGERSGGSVPAPSSSAPRYAPAELKRYRLQGGLRRPGTGILQKRDSTDRAANSRRQTGLSAAWLRRRRARRRSPNSKLRRPRGRPCATIVKNHREEEPDGLAEAYRELMAVSRRSPAHVSNDPKTELRRDLRSGQWRIDTMRFEDYIKNVPDFPIPGIQFKDIIDPDRRPAQPSRPRRRTRAFVCAMHAERRRRTRTPRLHRRLGRSPTPSGRRLHPGPQAGQAAARDDLLRLRPRIRQEHPVHAQRRDPAGTEGASSSTTCSPPAARWTRPIRLIQAAGGIVVGTRLFDRTRRSERPRPSSSGIPVKTLIQLLIPSASIDRKEVSA
ncbi:MAG: hypothetical protein MZU97_11800 [Bacillus subtilis]|nr:hypothetical protein [Bacillus subtilis]